MRLLFEAVLRVENRVPSIESRMLDVGSVSHDDPSHLRRTDLVAGFAHRPVDMPVDLEALSRIRIDGIDEKLAQLDLLRVRLDLRPRSPAKAVLARAGPVSGLSPLNG